MVALPIAAALLVTATLSVFAAEPERKSVSQVAAELYLGILVEFDLSHTGAVEKFAKVHGWTKLDPSQAEMLNSKVSYFGELDGHKFMLGTDGTDDIFSIAIRQGFWPAPSYWYQPLS